MADIAEEVKAAATRLRRCKYYGYGDERFKDVYVGENAGKRMVDESLVIWDYLREHTTEEANCGEVEDGAGG